MNRQLRCAPAILLLWMLASDVSVAGINRWTTGGPAGFQGGAAVVRTNPIDPSNLYASDFTRLFRSRDGGATWSADASLTEVSDLAFEPGSVDTIYAIAGGDVLKTTDGGQSWRSLGFLAVSTPAAIMAIGDSRPSTILVGTLQGASLTSPPARLFRSADGGAHWTEVHGAGGGGVTSLLAAPSIAVDYSSLAGQSFRQEVRSGDDGQTWTQLGPFSGSFDAEFSFVAIDPEDPAIVYANAGGQLSRSIDAGSVWTVRSAGLPAPGMVRDLVIDPTAPSTLYASTEEGVFRSLDFAAHWTKFSDGLPDGPATSLTIDATGRFLHVAAGGGVYDMTITEPCAPTAMSLCFLGGRFLATAAAVDPRTGRLEHGTAVSRGDRFGYFSLPGFTGDSVFPEILVKMVDARALPGQGFWVFHSGLTDLLYMLSVFDTQTGRQETYRNDRSDPSSLCGGADTATFGPDTSVEMRVARSMHTAADGSTLALLDRFQATLTATDPRTGQVAEGLAVPQDGKWGYFSLPAFTGDPAFPEVFVKMVDATSLPGGFFWVFHTGLTDLEYELTVMDSKTGGQKVYRNDRSDPNRLCGGADTSAFTNDVTTPPPSTIDVLTWDGVTHHLDTTNFCLVGYQFQSTAICSSSLQLSDVSNCLHSQIEQSQMQSVITGGSSLACCKIPVDNVVWHVRLKAGGQFVGASCGDPSLQGRDVNTGMTTVIDYEQIARIVFP